MPSGAARAQPQLDVRQTLPAKHLFAGPVRLQMLNPVTRLQQCRHVAFLNPPHGKMRDSAFLEPFALAGIKPFVHRLPDKLLKRFSILPD